MNNTNNYLSPVQIEVFWLSHPDSQLVIQSNLPTRNDEEIIVHGPYLGREFKNKVELVLKESRWQVKKKIFDPFNDEKERYVTLGEIVAGEIFRFIEYSKFLLLNEVPISGKGGGISLEDKIWAQTYSRDISKNTYEFEVNKVLNEIKSQAKFILEERNKEKEKIVSKKPFSKEVIKKEPEPQLIIEQKWDGYGVHFFPPLVIGEKPKLTVHHILYGLDASIRFNEKAFDYVIDNKTIIVEKGGYIFVETKTKDEVIKILNLIMAVGNIQGELLFAVREQDVSNVNFDREKLTITGKQWHSQTIRSMLFEYNRPIDHYMGYPIKEISKEKLLLMIKQAFEVLKNEKLTENLRLYSESFTHLKNSEYAQSFIMSWSIIERHYSDIWRKLLDERDLESDRFSKLTNTALWSIDSILESLNLMEQINDNEYDLLMELKRKRNKFYHSGKIVSKEDAERCLNFIVTILDEKLKPIISAIQ